MDAVLLVGGLVLLIVGIVKRKLPWGKWALLAGVVLLVAGLILGWPDFVAGFREGYAATDRG